MKILLDECLPHKLKSDMSGHDVATVQQMGWAGLTNGELLRAAEPLFDIFITIDRGIKYQQNLRTQKLTIIQLSAHDNRYETLRPLMSQVLAALKNVRAGEITVIGRQLM